MTKDTGKLRWALGLFVALSFAAFGVACDDDGDDKAVDAAVDAFVALDGPGPAPDAASVPFGTACGVGLPACTGATNICARFPLDAARGQCSIAGCNATPGVCPASDPCNHVNLYVSFPGLPPNTWVCVAKEKLQAIGDAGAGNDGGNKDGGGDASGDAQKD